MIAAPDTEPHLGLETMHAQELSPTETRLDFSERTASVLLQPEEPYGFAYLSALGLLGVAHEVEGQGITLTGQGAQVLAAFPRLTQGADTLAKTSSALGYEFKQDSYERLIGQLLGRVTDIRRYPSIQTNFHHTAQTISAQFADAMLRPRAIRVVPYGPTHNPNTEPDSDRLIVRSGPLHRALGRGRLKTSA